VHLISSTVRAFSNRPATIDAVRDQRHRAAGLEAMARARLIGRFMLTASRLTRRVGTLGTSVGRRPLHFR
jgi:hypothetical protein